MITNVGGCAPVLVPRNPTKGSVPNSYCSHRALALVVCLCILLTIADSLIQMLNFLDQNAVPLRKVFWVGVIVSLFNPPVVGIVYALCFLFRSETRKVALLVIVWALVWTVFYSALVGFLVSQGYVHISVPRIAL